MKPKVDFTHVDGNIFAVLGTVRQALRRVGKFDEAKEVSHRVLSSKSYEEALTICFEYVDANSGEDDKDENVISNS